MCSSPLDYIYLLLISRGNVCTIPTGQLTVLPSVIMIHQNLNVTICISQVYKAAGYSEGLYLRLLSEGSISHMDQQCLEIIRLFS